MPQTVAVARPNTAARWIAAHERAIADGLRSFNIAGDAAMWFVTSANAIEAGYIVTIQRGNHQCQCDAAVHGDSICKHRALVLHRLGMLPVARPVAVAVLPEAVEDEAEIDLSAMTDEDLAGVA